MSEKTTETAALPQLMSAKEVAAIVRLSRATVYRMMESGALPYVRFSKKARRVKCEDVQRLIDENTVSRAEK